MVTLRKSNKEDLNYVLEVEEIASRTAFVNKWSKQQHVDAINSDVVDHMIIESSESVGYLIANRNADDNYELMRIVVSKKNRGYGKAAIIQLLEFAFTQLNTHRFWLDVRMHNTSAIKLYRSIGFAEEGILRECVKYNDTYVSAMVMSILRGEYEL